MINNKKMSWYNGSHPSFTQLAEFSSGIGTAGAILEVDNVNNKIGIGTTNPQALLQVGDIIKMDGVSGVITATSFVGNVTGVATGLSGTPDITVGNIVAAGATFSGVVTYEDVTNVDSLGIVTARTGLEVTANGLVINAGVSTFAADLSIADKIVHTGDTNTAIRFPSADTFTVETSGTERFRVGSTGTVGVAGLSTATSFGAFNHLSAPFGGGTVSYTVTVATKTANHRYNGSGSSNGYLIDGVEAPFLTLTPGRTYRFVHDNTGSHPLKFYLEADKTTLYSTGVTFDNAYTEIVVSDSTPTILHYQCTNHGYMGNAVQVNSNISGGLVGTPDIDCGTGSFTGDVDIADKIIHTGDTNTAIRFPAADTFTVETGGSERVRVDSDGKFLVGTTATSSNQSGALNVFGTDGTTSFVSIRRGSSNVSGPRLALCKSRNTTDGSNTIVQDNDILGTIHFYGNDGAGFEEGAAIAAEVDGTPGSDDLPTSLTFSTTPDGSATKVERLRITPAGNLSMVSGATILYGDGDVLFTGDSDFNWDKSDSSLKLQDNAKVKIGTGDDLQIFHNGSHSIINNTTGSFQVQDGGTEKFRVSGTGTFFKDDVTLSNDNDKLNLGAGNDLQIYHDGSNNYVNATNGSLFIRGSDLVLEDADGNDYITCSDGGTGGTVTLKHLGSAKLATSSTGVTVTGTLNATSDVQINGTSAATTGKAIAMSMIFG